MDLSVSPSSNLPNSGTAGSVRAGAHHRQNQPVLRQNLGQAEGPPGAGRLQHQRGYGSELHAMSKAPRLLNTTLLTARAPGGWSRAAVRGLCALVPTSQEGQKDGGIGGARQALKGKVWIRGEEDVGGRTGRYGRVLQRS